MTSPLVSWQGTINDPCQHYRMKNSHCPNIARPAWQLEFFISPGSGRKGVKQCVCIRFGPVYVKNCGQLYYCTNIFLMYSVNSQCQYPASYKRVHIVFGYTNFESYFSLIYMTFVSVKESFGLRYRGCML